METPVAIAMVAGVIIAEVILCIDMVHTDAEGSFQRFWLLVTCISVVGFVYTAGLWGLIPASLTFGIYLVVRSIENSFDEELDEPQEKPPST